MTVDLEYCGRVNKAYVFKWWKDHEGTDRSFAISILAGITTIPCITIAYWLGEANGWESADLKDSVDTLIAFYGYNNIVNKPEGCPW